MQLVIEIEWNKVLLVELTNENTAAINRIFGGGRLYTRRWDSEHGEGWVFDGPPNTKISILNNMESDNKRLAGFNIVEKEKNQEQEQERQAA